VLELQSTFRETLHQVERDANVLGKFEVELEARG
jgi:hypothetical protein